MVYKDDAKRKNLILLVEKLFPLFKGRWSHLRVIGRVKSIKYLCFDLPVFQFHWNPPLLEKRRGAPM